MLTAVLVAASNFVSGGPPSFILVLAAPLRQAHWPILIIMIIIRIMINLMIKSVIVIMLQIMRMRIVMIVINCDTKTAVAEEESWGRTSSQLGRKLKFESVFYVELVFSLVLCTLCIWYLYLLYFFCISVLLNICICCCCAPRSHQFLQLLTKYTNIYFQIIFSGPDQSWFQSLRLYSLVILVTRNNAGNFVVVFVSSDCLLLETNRLSETTMFPAVQLWLITRRN